MQTDYNKLKSLNETLFNDYDNIEKENNDLLNNYDDIKKHNKKLMDDIKLLSNNNLNEINKLQNLNKELCDENDNLYNQFITIKNHYIDYNSNIYTEISQLYDNKVFSEKIFDYLQSLNIEPFLNYTIINNIIKIYKHEVLSLKHKKPNIEKVSVSSQTDLDSSCENKIEISSSSSSKTSLELLEEYV